jgi:hypothetical protein
VEIRYYQELKFRDEFWHYQFHLADKLFLFFDIQLRNFLLAYTPGIYLYLQLKEILASPTFLGLKGLVVVVVVIEGNTCLAIYYTFLCTENWFVIIVLVSCKF